MFFVLVVSYFTLFLNIEVLPNKLETNSIYTTQTYPLFKVEKSPLVPTIMFQENFGVNTLSPDKDTKAYLYPEEWETVGDIYMKEGIDNTWTRLQLNQQVRKEMWNTQESAEMKYTPKKKILWINNEEFLTIIGYAQGTTSTGGDCVKVNKLTGQAEIIYPAHNKLNQEVTDFEILDGKLKLHINIIDQKGLSKGYGVIEVEESLWQ